MTEQLQRRIEEALHHQMAGAGQVTASQLQHAAIPEGLRHFLVKSLQRRIHLETHQALACLDSWIDVDHESVHAAAELSAEMLFQTARFSEKDWKRACSQAVSALLQYLYEPARALSEFSFPSGMHSVPADDLRRRSGYFSDYPYIARAIDAWLEQRTSDIVDRSAFESAMCHLDARMTEDHGTDQWMGLLQPMIDLVTFAGIEPDGVPVSMMARFFEAKDRPALASLVQSAASVHSAEMITVPSLREIIDKGLENERLQHAQQSAPPPPAATVETSESARAPVASDSKAPDAPAAKDLGQPLPLWKRFQQRADGMESSSSSSAAQGPDKEGQPLWKSFESPQDAGPSESNFESESESELLSTPESLEDTPVADPGQNLPIQEAPRLESQHIVLGTAVRSRERFIRALFDNDETSYTDVMDDLAEAPDWSSASSIIAKRIYKPYRIDIYSDVAVDFTNAVEARYSGIPS